MSHVVVWVPSPLYLTKVIRDTKNNIESGYVINGDWNFEIRNEECLAKDGNKIVNRWKKPDKIDEVIIPKNIKFGYDYNKAIKWAEARRAILCSKEM